MASNLVSFLFNTHRQRYDFDSIPRPQPPDFAVEFFGESCTNGVFADVGANDGITWSNSHALETCMGWKGICVEPHPDAFERLTKVRGCHCFQCGALDKPDTLRFWKIRGGAEMLSGFESGFDARFKDRIHEEVRKNGDVLEIVPIPVRTVTELLEEAGFSKLDYLSIDTEGAELGVLKGVNFDKYAPALISCENNYEDSPVQQFLRERGYKKLRRVCADEFYSR